MGARAIVGIEMPKNISKIGEARDSDIFIEAYRIPPIDKNVVLAYRGDYNDYRYLLEKYDWSTKIADKIMFCESSYNAKAIGDTNTKYHSYGLMQIRLLPERNYTIEELFDAERNIEIAYEIYKKQGWGAWHNCYKKIK